MELMITEDYDNVRYSLGEEEWLKINWFLLNNDKYTLDDVLEKREIRDEYSSWIIKNPLPSNFDGILSHKVLSYLSDNNTVLDGTDEMLNRLNRSARSKQKTKDKDLEI